MKSILKLSSVLAVALLTPALAAHANSFSTAGDVTVVSTTNGPAWQLTSNSANTADPYGTLVLTISGTLTASQISNLSAEYQMITGTFGGGSPRFSLVDTSGNSNNAAYVYFGTPNGSGGFTDPNSGSYGSTGNLVGSSDARVDVNGFGGSNAYEESWANFLANDGNIDISQIDLVLDGGWNATQIADIQSFALNGTPYTPAATPEPASLLLLATGLFGAAGESFRRHRHNASQL